MSDPVASLFGIRELAPGLRLYQSLRTIDDLELPVFQNLPDKNRPVGVI